MPSLTDAEVARDDGCCVWRSRAWPCKSAQVRGSQGLSMFCANRDNPYGGLPADRSDHVVGTVAMQQGHAMTLSGRRHQQNRPSTMRGDSPCAALEPGRRSPYPRSRPTWPTSQSPPAASGNVERLAVRAVLNHPDLNRSAHRQQATIRQLVQNWRDGPLGPSRQRRIVQQIALPSHVASGVAPLTERVRSGRPPLLSQSANSRRFSRLTAAWSAAFTVALFVLVPKIFAASASS